MPDPELIIWGLIALAAVILFPVRMWMRSRYRRDEDDADDGADG